MDFISPEPVLYNDVIYESPAVTSYGGDSFFGIFSMFSDILMIPVILLFFLLIALVLYYYTGSKKKADEFWPKLMSMLLRTYSYVWLIAISVTGFVALAGVLNYIFAKILPESDYSFYSEVSESTMAKFFVLGVIAAAMAIGKVYLNRMNVKTSGAGGTDSTKIFVIFGLSIFSIIMFISLITSSLNIVDYFYDSEYGINPMSLAIFFSSLAAWLVYLWKGMEVLKGEKES